MNHSGCAARVALPAGGHDGRDAIHGAAAAAEPGVNFNAVGVRLRAKVSQGIEAGGDTRGPGQNSRLPVRAVRGEVPLSMYPTTWTTDRVVVARDQSRDHGIHFALAAHPDMKDIGPGRPELGGGGGAEAARGEHDRPPGKPPANQTTANIIPRAKSQASDSAQSAHLSRELSEKSKSRSRHFTLFRPFQASHIDVRAISGGPCPPSSP